MTDAIRLTFDASWAEDQYDQESFLAVIPSRLVNREALFTVLAQTLHFPNYFGRNWDALYDMLCDFCWLECRRIIIMHHDIPLLSNQQAARMYLSILNDSVKIWEGVACHELVAVFPAEYEKEARNLLI